MTTTHAEEPDPALRAAFRRGDPDAIEALAERFHADLRRFSVAMLGDPEAAEDAAAETFLRLMERHRLYDPERPIRPWLFAVCRRCCVDVSRRNGRQRARIVDIEDGDMSELPEQRDTARQLIERLDDATTRVALDHAVGLLPSPQRAVVTLHAFEEMTFREVGAVLDMPQATAATLYYRALSRLREHLAPIVSERLATHG